MGKTLTSTMQMSLLEPAEHDMDMAMDVVPSVFGATVFSKNVWEVEDVRNRCLGLEANAVKHLL